MVWQEIEDGTRAAYVPNGMLVNSYSCNTSGECTSEAMVFIPCSFAEARDWMQEHRRKKFDTEE